jgi:hypothetical protein
MTGADTAFSSIIKHLKNGDVGFRIAMEIVLRFFAWAGRNRE